MYATEKNAAISRFYHSMRWEAKKHTLEMTQITLLVETCLLQSKTMSDIEDGLGGVIESLLALFSGRVGADVDGLAADGDLLAVGFVDDVINQFEIVRVGDDFVASDKVLFCCQYCGGEGMGGLGSMPCR
jgi:hypothetical protein